MKKIKDFYYDDYANNAYDDAKKAIEDYLGYEFNDFDDCIYIVHLQYRYRGQDEIVDDYDLICNGSWCNDWYEGQDFVSVVNCVQTMGLDDLNIHRSANL